LGQADPHAGWCGRGSVRLPDRPYPDPGACCHTSRLPSRCNPGGRQWFAQKSALVARQHIAATPDRHATKAVLASCCTMRRRAARPSRATPRHDQRTADRRQAGRRLDRRGRSAPRGYGRRGLSIADRLCGSLFALLPFDRLGFVRLWPT
jgi:hypothetical protein